MSVVSGLFKSKETWTDKISPRGRKMKMERKSIAWRSQLHEGVVPLIKLLQFCKGASPWCQPVAALPCPRSHEFSYAFKLPPSNLPSYSLACGCRDPVWPRGHSRCLCTHITHTGSFALLRGVREDKSREELLWEMLGGFSRGKGLVSALFRQNRALTGRRNRDEEWCRLLEEAVIGSMHSFKLN